MVKLNIVIIITLHTFISNEKRQAVDFCNWK